MMTAKVFENGRSQAVRLPKQCRFQTDEVHVNKIGDIVMLIPKDSKWQGLLHSLDLFSEDFMEPVSRRSLGGSGTLRKKLLIVEKCCFASTSVGAIRAL